MSVCQLVCLLADNSGTGASVAFRFSAYLQGAPEMVLGANNKGRKNCYFCVGQRGYWSVTAM